MSTKARSSRTSRPTVRDRGTNATGLDDKGLPTSQHDKDKIAADRLGATIDETQG